jgi:hypothetical protein
MRGGKMKIQIKMSEVNNFFQGEYGNLFQKEIGISLVDESIEILMGEMNEVMENIFKDLGFYIDGKFTKGEYGKWLFWDSDNFSKIDWWVELVYECYEGKLSEIKDVNLWESFFEFSGDDDVDYNGSYIDGVNQFLQWLFKRDLLNNYSY